MADSARAVFLTILLVAGPVAATPNTPTYVLKGYRFGGDGWHGAKPAEFEARLKDRVGARITEGNVAADADILRAELKARHIGGQLYVSVAEGRGNIWVMFDLWDTGPPGARFWTSRRLQAQHFDGFSGIPPDMLAARSGLKSGDTLSPEKIKAAHDSIAAVYRRLRPGETGSRIKVRIQTEPDDRATVTWFVARRD